MQKLIIEYANLLLKCLKLTKKDYLFISIPNYLCDFANILVKEAEKYHLRDIYIDYDNPQLRADLLIKENYSKLIKHPLFNHEVYNHYAHINAAFLFIQSPIPGLFRQVNPNLMARVSKYEKKTQKEFRDLYEADKVRWCMAGVPNKLWAERGLKMSLEQLWHHIFKVCLVDEQGDAYQNWQKQLAKLNLRAKKLNALHLTKLHYYNQLGTDLMVALPDNHIWCTSMNEKGTIANMPSAEVFTSPLYKQTEGIVYSSLPLYYNNNIIADFYLRFKAGKVVDFHAKKGNKYLKALLKSDATVSYLGECALVDYDSPINMLNFIFKETLYDENARCHLALGRGFAECLAGSNKNLRHNGVNSSPLHVDFMIGTEDLTIEGITKDNQKVLIMQNGQIML